MNKNTLLALVLIGGILLITPWYMKNVIGVKPQPKSNITADSLATSPASIPATKAPVEIGRSLNQHVTPVAVEPEAGAELIWVETDLYRGALSTLGGGTIVHWELKDYLKGDKSLSQAVNIIPEGAIGNLGMTMDGGVDLSRRVFQKVADTHINTDNGSARRLAFELVLDNGGVITRTFTFEENRFDFDFQVKISGINTYDAGYVLHWDSGLLPTEQRVKDDMPYVKSVAMQGGEVLSTKSKSTGFSEGTTEWAAVRVKYFIAALIPRSQKGRGVTLSGEEIKIHEDGKLTSWKKMRMGLAMSGTHETDLDVYLGPLDLPTVKSLGVNLEKTMNFGWTVIQPISKAFYYVLQAMYDVIGNYGWTIILFSIMIKIVLYPLTRKSFQSMKEMQKLQPRIKDLQAKYKSDPQRMNKEVQKVYKEHGVNPLGGCLPMLLQMPVLFALFNLFRTTIMLRQAEWLMISDLSAPDGILMGIHILPILMGVTMIFQQKLSGGQNPQQKMMAYMMPVMMTFMFYRISAGLNLYYMMFNLLTIVQELIVKRNKKEEVEA
ncbi:membrane protein insertase YidC [bacterium]|nr:membrane protein insertase YidC [bacterium]